MIAPFTAWPVHWVGRGAAKPLVGLLVELLQSFVRSFVQSLCRALVELSAELLQSFGRSQYFDVRHVDSATTYRAVFFFKPIKSWLGEGLKIWTRKVYKGGNMNGSINTLYKIWPVRTNQ